MSEHRLEAQDQKETGSTWYGTGAKQTLAYDARDMRYHGVQSDGTPIQIDADAFAEAIQRRRQEGNTVALEDWQLTDEAVFEETADPDGWSEDMAGWIPAGE